MKLLNIHISYNSCYVPSVPKTFYWPRPPARNLKRVGIITTLAHACEDCQQANRWQKTHRRVGRTQHTAYLAVFRFSYLPLIGTFQMFFFLNGNLCAVDVRQTLTGIIREIHNPDQVMFFVFNFRVSEGTLGTFQKIMVRFRPARSYASSGIWRHSALGLDFFIKGQLVIFGLEGINNYQLYGDCNIPITLW